MHPYPAEIVARSREPEAQYQAEATRAVPVRVLREGVATRAMCPHCSGEIALSAVASRWTVRGPTDVADRLMVQLGNLEREEMHVLLLNTRNVVTAQERIYQGNVSAAIVRVGELFQAAVKTNAASIILCHNHPSGDATPSADDLFLTAEAVRAGRLLDVAVLDHLIIGAARFASLRDQGVDFGERRRSSHAGAADEPADDSTIHRVRARRRFGAGLRLEGSDVVDPTGARHSVADAIHRLPWRWVLPGGGMPAHQYVVIGRSDPAAVDILDCVIRLSPSSYRAYFRGYQHPMRYVEIDGWRYWRTRAGGAHMLNRCRLDSVEPPRRVDDGARPIPWLGPPWAPYGSPWPPGYVEVGGRWVYRPELDPRRNFKCPHCSHSYWRTAHGRPCPHCGSGQSKL